MIRAIEVYDTFNPKRLLEVKFVLCNSLDGRYVAGYDMNKEEIGEGRTIYGFTATGRTFRSSYKSLREVEVQTQLGLNGKL